MEETTFLAQNYAQVESHEFHDDRKANKLNAPSLFDLRLTGWHADCSKSIFD